MIFEKLESVYLEIEDLGNRYFGKWKFGNVFFEIYGYLHHVLSFFVKMGTGNDDDWLNKLSKIMDMNYISIKKHEMEISKFWSIKHIELPGSDNKRVLQE